MYIHHTSKWVQWFHLSWVECSRCLDTRDTFIPASDYLYPIKQWHLIYHTHKLLDWMLLTRIFITSDDREVGSICSQLTLLIGNWNAGNYPFFLLNGLIGSWQIISLQATSLMTQKACDYQAWLSLPMSYHSCFSLKGQTLSPDVPVPFQYL